MFNRYLAEFPADAERLTVLSDQLEKHSDAFCHRGGLPGHLTASALVFDGVTKRFLLIHHNFLQRWLQPGGHLDRGEHPLDGARRELLEEVGDISVRLHPWHETNGIPIDIDSHRIPASEKKAEPEHLHHDFQYIYLLQANAAVSLQLEEVGGFRWAPLVELHGGDFGNRLARTVDKMLRLKFSDIEA